MLEIKHFLPKTGNVFDELLSRPDLTKESISEITDLSIKTCQTERQREKHEKKQMRVSKQLQKV
jgi:hypothetical protein